MPLEIVRDDITHMRVDAIVNAANERLAMGGGVCGAIFAAAGPERLAKACARIGLCKTGDAVITGGFALPAKHIIHAVGPVWQGGGSGETELLGACYDSALLLAHRRNIRSIAFPLISSGIYGVPKDIALRVATAHIGAFLQTHEMDVFLVVFDRASYQIGEQLFHAIRAFIDDRYAEKTAALYARRDALSRPTDVETLALDAAYARPAPAKRTEPMAAPCAAPSRETLDRMLRRAGESFSERLLRLVDERGMTDPEVYRRANIDRRLFSKIRARRDYRPTKNTALALAIALRLNLDDTADLLRRAGYALSPSDRADLIVEYFLRAGNYNIFEINEALFAFDESLLGS